MERIPAFKPKNEEVENSPEQEKIKAPLKSLEEDKAEIAGFNYALDLVLSGQVNTEESINALRDLRFDYDDKLTNSIGDRIYRTTADGRRSPILRNELSGKKITKEEVSVLTKIAVERNDAKTKKESAESEIAGFNYALDLVLSGQVNTEESINALRDLRFDYDDKLTNSIGDRIYRTTADGRRSPILRNELSGKKITKEEVSVLTKIAVERNDAKTKKESAESEIAGFNYALDLVLSGQVNTEESINALRDLRFDYDDKLTNSIGDRIYRTTADGRRSPILRNELSGKKITKEEVKLLNRLLIATKTSSFPDEVKENLKKYVQTQDGQVLERLRTVLADSGNEKMSSEVNDIVLNIINNKRTAELKKDVYGGIVQNKPIAELAQRLSAFEGKETDDLKLVAELQTAIAAKRKRDIIASASRDLQLPARDIDKTLAEITPLLSSAREDERRAGVEVLKAAYRVEIANFKNEVQKMITSKVDPEMLRIYIDGLPIRPSTDDIDYVQTVVSTREKAFASVNELLKVRSVEAATRIRESFANLGVDLILANIGNFPGETERDRAIKVQLLELYKSYVAANKPEIFDDQFAKEIQKRESEQMEAKFIDSELGRNKESFDFIRNRFVETIYPLVESLRADKTTSAKIKSFLETDAKNPSAPNPRRQFEQRMSLLEKQRELTDAERNYLQSVEMLSVFNPYLVACAYADPGVTSEFLRHHFETISRETASELKDGDYFPLLHVGLGPDGIAALGETVRNNADLASSALIIDAGKQPGGPFAIPEGAAWELNSANRRGAGGKTLPKKPGVDELKTVRAYGSPMRWYPGERGADKSIRQGSINTTVDYLPTPDELSNARYPTNEELQLILSLQAALLTKNIALQTKLVGLEKNPDPQAQGDKIATLEITGSRGTRRVRIGTDAIFAATGLGESGYGFELKGSRAEKVMEETKTSKGFPKISRTLEAFNALSGRSNEQISPGETIVIWGKGNSADTLIENIGSIFQGDNPRVRDITKVYVIADGDLSARPRYALINDLKPRNGRGNLIEQIKARVVDVDFAARVGDPATRKIVFYDASGKMIKNSSGEPIIADAGIAATGFRSKLDPLLENYAFQKSGDKDKESLREALTLPTNPDVSVAETLKSDPSVLILGTASDADFENIDKLAQLPVEAREALLRNGAENAVAIGFRAPDTQAAVNIWLNSRNVQVEAKSATSERKLLAMDNRDTVEAGTTFWLEKAVSPDNIRTPNNIENELRLLSPLFAYNVGNSIELNDANGKRFTGELNFEVTYNLDDERLGIKVSEQGNQQPVPKAVAEAIKEVGMDLDFQKYALIALKKKRRNPKLEIVLSFKNGFVDPKTTFVQS